MITTRLRRYGLVVSAFLFCTVISYPHLVSAALSAEQRTVFKRGIGAFSVEVDCNITSGALGLDGTLPDETIEQLRSGQITSNLEKMKDVYAYVQGQTNVPWQILAAIHYREGGMSPTTSIFNGQPLGDYKNADGVMLSADEKVDAINAAKHLIANAKSVYGVDATNANSVEALGQIFLAYNRGGMYKNWSKTWQDSPYVMNGFDTQHIHMKWIDADSYVSPGGRQVNSISGQTDNRPGALSVYKFLLDNTTSTDSSGATSANTCAASGAGNATIVGNVAFPLIMTKGEVDGNNKGLFRNGTTSQAGHPYIAYDILAPPRTKVAAFMGGKVLRTNSGNACKSNRTTVVIWNPESRLSITYIHIFKTSYIQEGDTVTAGQVIAEIGTRDYGCGIAHLHIDANVTEGRPPCARPENGGCSSSNKSKFRSIGSELYKTYMALPTEGVSSL